MPLFIYCSHGKTAPHPSPNRHDLPDAIRIDCAGLFNLCIHGYPEKTNPILQTISHECTPGDKTHRK